MNDAKRYLGDGAYVLHGAYRGEVVIQTENGLSVTNRVFLDPTGLRALLEWMCQEFELAVVRSVELGSLSRKDSPNPPLEVDDL